MILNYSSIHLYSFNLKKEITTDLNFYHDEIHYGEWVNSMILNWLKDSDSQLTKNNYIEYINEELDFYINYDYDSLNFQEDYVNDNCVMELYLNKFFNK